MEKGDVTYELRADDSKIEGDLEQANRKVEKTLSKIKHEKVEIDVDADTAEAKQKLEDLANVTDELGYQLNDPIKPDEKTISLWENLGNIIKGSFSEAAGSSVPLVGKIGELTAGLSGSAAAAIGVGAAAVGVGVLAVETANDISGAMNDFIAVTGKGTEETERYQAVMEDIYANNYGESFSDIGQAMADVTRNLGDMDDVSLQNVTESAFALRDTFGYDIPESTRAAKAMIDNFGISGEEAMNLIASGAQNGLDYSGELLDSISEYSVQFDKMGLGAEDMFAIFQKGAESGAFNLDKVGDAVKEMSIRVVDGSETTRQGFELLGLNADEMAQKFAAGGDTAKEAFNETLDALAAMEDPIAQNTAGVDLMGTMWEDLGPEAVTALAEIEEEAYATSDAMNQIKEVKYDDLGSMFEELKRNIEVLLIPLGEALLPVLSTLVQSVLPILTSLLGPLISLFAELITPILNLIQQALQPLMDAFLFLMDNVISPFIALVTGLLAPAFSGALDGMLKTAEDIIGNITNIFRNIIDFIRNVFTGNWRGAWDNIKNIFSNAVGSLAAIFKAPINAIVVGWNRLASSLGTVKAPSWVPVVGGKSFSLPRMSRLKVGLDYVPNDMFPAFLDEGEWVLTREEANLLRSLGGISGLQSFVQNPEMELSPPVQQVITKEIIIHTHVDLDGEEVGNSVTKYVDRNMADDEELKARGC